ncbi:MAG: S1/P1 nuclease, partial [Calditrichia bacterium]
FGEPTNLHRVWDYQMIERTGIPWPQYADSLQKTITEGDLQKWNSLDPVAWVNESFRLAHNHAYKIPKDHRIGETYYEKNIAIVDEQLKKAGVRLALFLNAIFQ